jgi:hypothetical protein
MQATLVSRRGSVVMIGAGRLAIKIIGSVGIVTLLYCAVLTKGSAAGPMAQQQGSDKPKLPVCPELSLQGFDSIDLTKIAALQPNGILGLPCDAEAENGKADARSLQHGFDYYSWLTFLALNSPASGAAIGPDAPTVWETYKQLPDVMLPNGEAPETWAVSGTNPLVGANKQVQLTGCPNPDGKMIIHMDMEETYNEPFKSGPLFDQNGNYAVFVIFMNQAMFEYVSLNTLYNREGQANFSHEIDFPDGSDGKAKGHPETTVGAIMIKASWKLMGPADLAKPKYHMIDALLYRGPKSCTPVKLGLIGFHVGHKTVTRQQWIWTTFEFNDNVPTEQQVIAGIPSGQTYNFYDPHCHSCSVNQTPQGSWDPDTLGWSPFPKNPKFKSQIVRTGSATHIDDGNPNTVEDDIKALNDRFHAWPQIAHSVWVNYNLVTTQWPSGFPCAGKKHPGNLPDPTCTPFPTFLANSTLETFSQPLLKVEVHGNNDPGVPLATSSCISCHNNATTNPTHRNPGSQAARSDFTYILEKAHSKEESDHD